MKSKILGGVILGFVTVTSIAEASAQPDMVVGIVVDQLRTDYLERLKPLFGEGGFKRLMEQGVYFKDVDFHNTVADFPTGAAVIYTGAWPTANGVAGGDAYDSQSKSNVPTLARGSSKISPEYSPELIQVSTLADEYYVNASGLTKIYSVAANPQVAVVTSGHAGSAAVWFDETKGRWSVPRYYSGIPSVVSNQNHTGGLIQKIQRSVWIPSASTQQATPGNQSDFRYAFAGGGRDANLKYKNSALFNEDVTALGLDLVKLLSAGRTSGQTSMLNLAYSLAPYEYDYDGDARPELLDSYLRLDEQLATLIDSIYKVYGAENTLIFLASSGYATEPDIDEKSAKIPTGEITLKKVESLLNAYLSAIYGNADYVALISDGRLYFDTSTVDKKGIDKSVLRLKAKEFLFKMSGVQEVYSIDDIYKGGSRKLEELVLGIDMKNTPDMFIYFNPGWVVVDDNVYPEKRMKVRSSAVSTPVFILDSDMKPVEVANTVDATKIAPTISSMIHIRAPNGASEKPMEF